jgi:peptide/nickel transport system substrate-binding protein
MSIDKGIENGLATPDMSPWEFAPSVQHQLEWPKWGQYRETKGKAGEPPDLPSAIRLLELYNSWLNAGSGAEHAAIWHEMLRIWADEVFSIGLIGGVLQPVVVNSRLRNVPTASTTGIPARISACTGRTDFGSTPATPSPRRH